MTTGRSQPAATSFEPRRVPALPVGVDEPDAPARVVRPRGSGSASRSAEGRPPADPVRGRTALRPAADIDDNLDRNLLCRIGGTDREAFRQLYLRYHTRLARFLQRVLGRPGDVEDVVNDAMLVVWQRAGDFRGASRVSTWIFSISRNCALAANRRGAIRARADALEIQGTATVTDDCTDATEARQILDWGLARLPVDQRVVLVLAYYLDCSCEDIAAIVNCPVNTVKTRLFNARRKLRTVLADANAR